MDTNTELEISARPVDGQRATEAPPSSEGPILEPTVTPAPAAQQKEPGDKPSGSSQADASVAKPFYQGFKAGDTDPLVDVVIKAVVVDLTEMEPQIDYAYQKQCAEDCDTDSGAQAKTLRDSQRGRRR